MALPILDASACDLLVVRKSSSDATVVATVAGQCWSSSRAGTPRIGPRARIWAIAGVLLPAANVGSRSAW
jgi:hypothetical protein